MAPYRSKRPFRGPDVVPTRRERIELDRADGLNDTGVHAISQGTSSFIDSTTDEATIRRIASKMLSNRTLKTVPSSAVGKRYLIDYLALLLGARGPYRGF
jgi:hypothetical protein